MIPVLLLMFVGGIGLAQAVSNPRRVTLHWLRLGSMIAVALLATATTVVVMQHGWGLYAADLGHDAGPWDVPLCWLEALVPAVFFVGQLLVTQIVFRKFQRFAAACGFVVASCAAWMFMVGYAGLPDFLGSSASTVWRSLIVLNMPLSLAIGAGLLGGFLMTMLLGHAYLTAGGAMTQAPFKRLVFLLALLLGLRLILSVSFGLLPWWLGKAAHTVDTYSQWSDHIWMVVMLTARYLVGLAAPAVFTYLTYDCVRLRSNQSATGILYVAGVLVIIGEGIALGLMRTTGVVF